MDKPNPQDIALRIQVEGQVREVTYQQLALSNNLAQESLVRLLIKKKLISAAELLDEMHAVRTERYRPLPEEGQPDASTHG